MPYGLRAKTDLKRPQRYSQANAVNNHGADQRSEANIKESPSKPPLPPIFTIARADSHQTVDPLPTLSPPAPSPSPPLTSPAATSPTTAAAVGPALALPAVIVSAPSRRRVRNMLPSVKQVRKDKRSRDNGEPTSDYENSAPSRRPSRRPRRRSIESASVVPSIYPTLTPSAFPTKSGTPPPKKHAQTLEVERQQYARHIMEARKDGNQKRIRESEQAVDRLYACAPPTDQLTADDPDQSRWYRQVKERSSNDYSSAEVIHATNTAFCDCSHYSLQVLFSSLSPSLRQVIIDSIRDEFPPGSYHDPYFPVQIILGLTYSQLSQIIAENIEVWNSDEEIIPHLRELKQQYPDEGIDPDLPPPLEVVRAIKFLKQNHLAGNLLGEWQLPLPSAECFAMFAEESLQLDIPCDPGESIFTPASLQPEDHNPMGPRHQAVTISGRSKAPSKSRKQKSVVGGSRFTSQSCKLDASVATSPAPSSSAYRPVKLMDISYTASELEGLRFASFLKDQSPPRNGSKLEYPFPIDRSAEAAVTPHHAVREYTNMNRALRLGLGDGTALYPVLEPTTRTSKASAAWLTDPRRIDTASVSERQYAQNRSLNTIAQHEFNSKGLYPTKKSRSPSKSNDAPPPAPPPPPQIFAAPWEIQQPASGQSIHNPTLLPYSEVDRMFAEEDEHVPAGWTLHNPQPATNADPALKHGPTPEQQGVIDKKIREMYKDLTIPLAQRPWDQRGDKKGKKERKDSGIIIVEPAVGGVGVGVGGLDCGRG
ncbi:hypothetical protein T440DRAFT_124797 [Plenodomus tracheiphilus IPT5]|uniref:Uncharacterized protein n=1 Tax=Plenodomus tracheiphilus IPT5 TaxID=1408161 RepID=A0A6A7B366_9PLEO|nr:hypothetical protein T440DRAFT_124797 [Plenodomus tracheiphilus IPT5]